MVALVFVVVTSGCRPNTDRKPPLDTTQRASYPSHWWAPVSEEGVPEWEILPQAAGPGEVILSKRHELGLLSNFAPTPFTFSGKRYASLEGFWQMMLYPERDNDPRAEFPGLHWEYGRDEVAQMTGFDSLTNSLQLGLLDTLRLSRGPLSTARSNPLMSAPEQKPRPAPVRTTAPTASSPFQT